METIEDLGTYTFKSLLENSVKKFADRPALGFCDGSGELNYQQVYDKSKSFSGLLSSLGLEQGSKIGILGIGCPNWGISYFGIVNQGYVAVPLLPDFSENEILTIFEHCELDGILIESRLYKKMEKVHDKFPEFVIELDTLTVLKNDTGHEADPLAIAPDVDISEDDIASIIYTSGTTGRSKGVVLSQKNLIWCAIQGQNCHRINKYDRCVSFLPLSHVYEFTIGFTMQMLNGAAVYYLGKPPVVSALLPAFAKIQPTIVCSVPLIIEKIYKNKILPEINKRWITKFLYNFYFFRKLINRKAGKSLLKVFGGHLCFLGIGGAKVDKRVEKFMKDAKIPYAIGYGLTETAPLLAASGVKITVPGTIGIAVPGVDLQIINKNKRGVGEVVAKGPNVMVGYYKDEELTRAAFTTEEDECGPGYFKTGDLGIFRKIKGMNRLLLMGRSKNMILGPSGENIYPEDIEFVLNSHPVVSESVVVEDNNGLVAIVTFDEARLYEEIEKRLKVKLPEKIPELSDLKLAAKDFGEGLIRDVLHTKESILNEIQFYVNSRTNKSSHISRIEQIKEFQKTASQKIKRFLYEMIGTKKKV